MSIVNENTVIGLASDHAGYDIKQVVKAYLDERGIAYKDFGTYDHASCDYPDFAHALAAAIEDGECYPGIAVCSTGNGINMALNHHHDIRSALCWAPELAMFARAHNNANVLVLPGNYVSPHIARGTVETFLATDFEGGRHERRVNKIPVD